MKTFDPSRDVVNQISPINEVISLGGSLFTGSAGEGNIKRFSGHWVSGSSSGSYFHTVYNTNYSASTAISLFDITYGQTTASSYYTNAAATNKTEKNRIYRLFAKILLGDETTKFNIDGTDRDDLIFVSIHRSQFKDQIKKGTTAFTTIFSGSGDSATPTVVQEASLNDDGAASSFTLTERGDRANLLSSSGDIVGQVFYQAGVYVFIPERIAQTGSAGGSLWSGSLNYESMVVSGGAGTFENTLDAIRYRFRSAAFTNQTDLHATFYFCRALNDEFNYSSNPSFTDTTGRIIPTSGAVGLKTRTYLTKVGLLGENGEVLAVASLSEPVKKTPDLEYVIKVRLDF